MSITRALLIVFTCFAITAAIVPVVRVIAFHISAVARPSKRKVHEKVMPQLGGLAIYLGFLFGYILFASETFQMISVLIGSFIVVLTGIIDDINPLPPRIKFFGQLVGAVISTFYGKIILTHITIFGVVLSFGWLAPLITIFFILGCMNCINFVDGLDGLAGGISSIFFFTVAIIGLFINPNRVSLDINMAFIMLGSTLGFLRYNFHPASIFMGDSGAMFLGYIISIIALLGYKSVTLTSFFTPIILLVIPILDTLFAILRRKLKGQSAAKPDKFHIHHQLLERFGHKGAVISIYVINGLFAVATIATTLTDQSFGMYIYIFLVLIIIWFIFSTNVVIDFKKKLKLGSKKNN